MIKLDSKMAKVVAEVASGCSYRKVAKQYKVSISHISKTVHKLNLDINRVRSEHFNNRGRNKKLSPKMYPELMRGAIKGKTHVELADEFGVARPTVTRILNQFGWYSKKEPIS